jgi:hypothetical protein
MSANWTAEKRGNSGRDAAIKPLIGAVTDEVSLTKEAFDALDEYSCSIPTGTTIGKRWKRGEPYHGPRSTWYLCEYVPCETPGHVGIRVRLIRIVTDENDLLIHKRLYGQ